MLCSARRSAEKAASFASQVAVQFSAIYCLFAICNKHVMNPFQLFKYILEHIMLSINHKNLKNLYLQNYKGSYWVIKQVVQRVDTLW